MSLDSESRSGEGAYYKGLQIQGNPEVHAEIGSLINVRLPRGAGVLDIASGTGNLAQR